MGLSRKKGKKQEKTRNERSREAQLYTLAGLVQETEPVWETADDGNLNKLDNTTKMKYKQSVLASIRMEKRAVVKKRLRVAAACAAVLVAATGIFHEEVRAAISRISYSLSEALGLQSDLAGYKEVLHTSVSAGGYIVTLEEAAAAPEKLALSYAVRREDGRRMLYGFENEFFEGPGTCFDVDYQLFINGVKASRAMMSQNHFLDEEEKLLGGQVTFDLNGWELSCENKFDFRIEGAKASWSFQFRADGSQMYADTKRMDLGYRYFLPNGASITLDELRINALEQSIICHESEIGATEPYAMILRARDEQGRTAEFYPNGFNDGLAFLMIADGGKGFCIDAKTAEVTLYLAEFVDVGPETEQGQLSKSEEEFIVPPVAVSEAADAGTNGKNSTEAGKSVVWELTRLQ